jgi:N-acetyl-anhydromuramyl-L-alanine amidase AmpD
MEPILDYFLRETEEINQKWDRIILCHTSRNIEEYLISIKYRINGNYSKIPHFIVDRKGLILKTLDTKFNSAFFTSKDTNQTSIIICLENLGWLEKKPLKDQYVNWIGNIYNGEVYHRSWRDYNIWQPYTDIQLKIVAELCNKLCKEFEIKNECIGTNTKIKGSEKYKGILTRSNIYPQLTDLSPAFDFQRFEKYFKNEQ